MAPTEIDRGEYEISIAGTVVGYGFMDFDSLENKVGYYVLTKGTPFPFRVEEGQSVNFLLQPGMAKNPKEFYEAAKRKLKEEAPETHALMEIPLPWDADCDC